MRRSDDQLPPVEVIGAAPDAGSVQRVSTGGGAGPPRRGVVAGVAVVGLLLAGLALGQDDSGSERSENPRESTTTTRPTTTTRRPTTTRPTTTTTVPTGPVFAGQGLTGWLLSGNIDGWTLIDLETGVATTPRLPFDDPYSTRVVTGGVVTVSAGAAAYHDLRIPEDEREPVPLGRMEQVVAASDREHVWLIGGGETDPGGQQARLVDLDGRVVDGFTVPIGGYTAAVEGGLLFERGGRVFVASRSGVRSVAVGRVLGAVGPGFLTFTCDEDATCGIDLRTSSGARIRRLPIDPGDPELGVGVSDDPNGRFTVTTYGAVDLPEELVISIFEPDGTLTASVKPPAYTSGPVSWLPGDAGLVTAVDNRISWLRPTGSGWTVEELPALARVSSEGVLAIAIPG